MWDVPGGFVEPLEHPEQAVRRELLEETGLEVAVGELIGVFADVYGEDGVATFNLYYSASVLSGERAAGGRRERDRLVRARRDPVAGGRVCQRA